MYPVLAVDSVLGKPFVLPDSILGTVFVLPDSVLGTQGRSHNLYKAKASVAHKQTLQRK